MPESAIAAANSEVQKCMDSAFGSTKRGQYAKFNPKLKAEVAEHVLRSFHRSLLCWPVYLKAGYVHLCGWRDNCIKEGECMYTYIRSLRVN